MRFRRAVVRVPRESVDVVHAVLAAAVASLAGSQAVERGSGVVTVVELEDGVLEGERCAAWEFLKKTLKRG